MMILSKQDEDDVAYAVEGWLDEFSWTADNGPEAAARVERLKALLKRLER